jgi:membrane protein YdbS with pleckstrin-like domain
MTVWGRAIFSAFESEKVWLSIIRAWALKSIWRKLLSVKKIYLVAYGVVLIIGMWLVAATYMVSDIFHGIVFMGILLVIYTLTVIHLYCKANCEKESRKQENKIKVNGIAAIQHREDGIMLMIPKTNTMNRAG